MGKKKSPAKTESETVQGETSAAEIIGEAVKETATVSEDVPAAAAETPVQHYFAGIDIVKILAIFLVVCIHFFLYNDFYYESLANRAAYGPIMFRWIAFTCVPLFMISTGYLMKNKTFSADHYKGLIKIIVIYIFISILCIKFKEHHFKEGFDAWKLLKGYLEYGNADYGWYLNYYIGIFLIIPFLNNAFNGCKNNRQKFLLVAFTLLLTVVARSLYLGFEQDEQIKLLPDYISGAWPLAYYFTGAFIRDCPPKRNVRNKLIILAILALATWFITWSTYKQTMANEANDYHFDSWHFNDYGTYPVYIMATCIFLLLFDITVTNKRVKWGLRQVSGVTLAFYLVSFIFDSMFYYGWQMNPDSTRHKGFNEKYAEVGVRLSRWYEVIPKIFIFSLISAIIIYKLYDLCEYLAKQSVEAIKAEKSAREEK